MTYFKNAIFMTLCVLCLLLSVYGAKSDYKGLKKSVDFLIDSVLEFRQEVRSLKDAVSILQQQMNTSEEEYAGQVAVFSESLPRPTDTSDIVSSLTDDINVKMMALKEGFSTEKDSIRNTLTELNEALTDMNQTLTETAVSITNKIEDLSRRENEREDRSVNNAEELQTSVKAQIDELEAKLSSIKDDIEKVCARKVADSLNDHGAQLDRRMLSFLKPFGFTQRGDSFYMYFHTQKTWIGAQTLCEKGGGYLAEIEDKPEYDFVRSLVADNNVWVGGTDQSREGHWIWAKSSSQINSELWRDREPNDANGGEDCAAAEQSSLNRIIIDALNDIPCSNRLTFVCEYNI